MKVQLEQVKRTIRDGQNFLVLPHPLTNFEIQKYQNEPKFKGVYSRNNLPRIKDGAYEINLNEHKSIGNHWIALYVNGDNGDNYSTNHKLCS